MQKSKNVRHGFTLVELLIVITIITILAGFSIPAVSGALERANRAKDLNNVKQLASVLLMEANENQGLFRWSETLSDTSPAGNATDIFQGLLKDGMISSPETIAGYGVSVFEGTDYDTLPADNVAWAYFAGLTTSDNDRLPLLMSKGNDDVVTTATLTGTPGDVALSGAGSAWGTKGMIVVYKGQNAAFKKADNDGNLTLGADSPTIRTNAVFLQP